MILSCRTCGGPQSLDHLMLPTRRATRKALAFVMGIVAATLVLLCSASGEVVVLGGVEGEVAGQEVFQVGRVADALLSDHLLHRFASWRASMSPQSPTSSILDDGYGEGEGDGVEDATMAPTVAGMELQVVHTDSGRTRSAATPGTMWSRQRRRESASGGSGASRFSGARAAQER